jgi:hypothetical protein
MTECLNQNGICEDLPQSIFEDPQAFAAPFLGTENRAIVYSSIEADIGTFHGYVISFDVVRMKITPTTRLPSIIPWCISALGSRHARTVMAFSLSRYAAFYA